MAPEQRSPRWKAIVGSNWPAISPAALNTLATRAREAADALPAHAPAQAKKAFDDVARSSTRLRPISEAMGGIPHEVVALRDALLAAATAFNEMAALVKQTRHSILAVVNRVDSTAPFVTTRQLTVLVHEARAEVETIAGMALLYMSPNELPHLRRVAHLLGVDLPAPAPAKTAPNPFQWPFQSTQPKKEAAGGGGDSPKYVDVGGLAGLLPGVHGALQPTPGAPTPRSGTTGAGPAGNSPPAVRGPEKATPADLTGPDQPQAEPVASPAGSGETAVLPETPAAASPGLDAHAAEHEDSATPHQTETSFGTAPPAAAAVDQPLFGGPEDLGLPAPLAQSEPPVPDSDEPAQASDAAALRAGQTAVVPGGQPGT
ncbi:MAG: hypothetical protein HOQ24_04945, partial [Mycobacteriaceae bacterium]|nr:hypothetical protein [Mycobacteriaceae bacterium]